MASENATLIAGIVRGKGTLATAEPGWHNWGYYTAVLGESCDIFPWPYTPRSVVPGSDVILGCGGTLPGLEATAANGTRKAVICDLG